MAKKKVTPKKKAAPKKKIPSQLRETLEYIRQRCETINAQLIAEIKQAREALEMLHTEGVVDLGICMEAGKLNSDVLDFVDEEGEPIPVHPMAHMLDHMEWARIRLWEADRELDEFIGKPKTKRSAR